MHQTLTQIQGELGKVIDQINAKIPNSEPLGIAHNNWSFPGLTKEELIEEAQSLIDLIEDQGTDELESNEDRLNDYLRRLQHIYNQTVPHIWSHGAQAVPTYLLTLQGLRKTLSAALHNEAREETSAKLRLITRQVRAMEARINGLEPRTTAINTMIERIEQAHNAADQLPTDLQSLKEARDELASLALQSSTDREKIGDSREYIEELAGKLKENEEHAQSVLERCETAYSAATSVGLAAAFTERSTALSKSMWFWVFGLVIALAAGSYLGSLQLHSLTETFKDPTTQVPVIVFNLALSLLSVGAPVWFAWLATKQIGQRFKLSEDYAFKASVSRAYEGFRREAARFDKEMEAQLLSSALCRLDELPLRLVETETHGSPWHELATSEVVKHAIRTVPGFTDKVKTMASQSVTTLAQATRKKNQTPQSSPGAESETV